MSILITCCEVNKYHNRQLGYQLDHISLDFQLVLYPKKAGGSELPAQTHRPIHPVPVGIGGGLHHVGGRLPRRYVLPTDNVLVGGRIALLDVLRQKVVTGEKNFACPSKV